MNVALNAQLSLKLHDVHQPPVSIPTDPLLLIYSVAAHDQQLAPVAVQLIDGNGDIVEDDVTITMTTIPATGSENYTGLLCTGTRIYSEAGYRYWVCNHNSLILMISSLFCLERELYGQVCLSD